MDHTAHHVNTRVPLHNLPACQKALEGVDPSIIVHRLRWCGLLRTLSVCRGLYDYENHRWLDFSGRPTTGGPTSRGFS